MFQKVFHVISETPTYITDRANKYFPSAQLSGEIPPEYGVVYHWAKNIRCVGSGWCIVVAGLYTQMASIVPGDVIASQLVKLDI